MLKVTNLTKAYGKVKAVQNLSFTVKPGEIFGLLGANGAGKTTTFKLITGLLTPDQGEITLNGRRIDYSVTDQISFLTEERSLLTKLTVQEQIWYYAGLKGMEENLVLKKLKYWLKRFKMEDCQNQPIKSLSKGNQQKVQFISTIISEPQLLILDEPFGGLDPLNAQAIKEVIKELQAEGRIILFSSHRLDEVEAFCERLLILDHGQTILKGKLKDIKATYQRQNIFIKATTSIRALQKIPGVYEVIKTQTGFQVKVQSPAVIPKVFTYLKTCSEVTEFRVEEPSLNEIFLAKVGNLNDE